MIARHEGYFNPCNSHSEWDEGDEVGGEGGSGVFSSPSGPLLPLIAKLNSHAIVNGPILEVRRGGGGLFRVEIFYK